MRRRTGWSRTQNDIKTAQKHDTNKQRHNTTHKDTKRYTTTQNDTNPTQNTTNDEKHLFQYWCRCVSLLLRFRPCLCQISVCVQPRLCQIRAGSRYYCDCIVDPTWSTPLRWFAHIHLIHAYWCAFPHVVRWSVHTVVVPSILVRMYPFTCAPIIISIRLCIRTLCTP